MASDEIVLELTKLESLTYTFIYPLDDGTIVYRNYSTERIYVKQEGREIDAVLPYGDIHNIGSHGNAVYFTTAFNGKIYKANFVEEIVKLGDLSETSTGTRAFRLTHHLNITFVRDQLENEKMYWEGLCSIVRDGHKYVYRLSEDPDRDAILLDVPEDELSDFRLIGVHRGTIIYATKDGGHLSVRQHSKNVIVIELPIATYYSRLFSRDTSSLIYITNGNIVVTLNTETMEFLPTLRFQNVDSISSFAGVHNGMITFRGKSDGENYLMTAEMPETHTSSEGL